MPSSSLRQCGLATRLPDSHHTPMKSFTALLSLASVLLSLHTSHAATAGKPNILIIIADDMGYADAGFHGCRDIPTPNLDSLARDGIRCSSGYVTGPYCSPTRAALLTGRAQTRFGHEFNPSGPAAGLPLTESTLANRLKSAGYHTGLVGKWHLGGSPAHHPLQRGFDEFFGFLGGAHSYTNPNGIQRGTDPVPSIDYTTTAFGREASSFVSRHAANPWFLCLAFNAVHTPLEATPEDLTSFATITDPQRRTYAAMLSSMDAAIGRLRATLTTTGQADNTLIAFFSDNGGPVMRGVTVNGSSNSPLRGSKRTTLEGGIRVPFVVTWPSHLKPGVFPHPVVQTDLHATALAAAGISPDPAWKLEGTNLLPHFSGTTTTAPHDALFWRFGDQMAILANGFKLVRHDTTADGAETGISPPRLYNLSTDIAESKDLAATHPDKLAALQSLWDNWNRSNIAPLWGADHARPRKPKSQTRRPANP